MSPFLFSADHAHTDLGRRARAAMTVADVELRGISDLFADYASAIARGDQGRVAEIRLAADPDLLAQLDGFNYPATA